MKVYLFLRNAAKRNAYVGMFHASLTESTKSSVQAQFKSPQSQLRVLCATVAFGMVGD